jgi:transposase
MIAAYCEQPLLAPFTVAGACIELRSAKGVRVVFETWLETCFIPALQPGQVVMGDKATFHQGGRMAALMAAAGCRRLYLPPYSPAFNRLEKCWAWLKSRIRKRLAQAASLRQAMESVLKEAVS